MQRTMLPEPTRPILVRTVTPALQPTLQRTVTPELHDVCTKLIVKKTPPTL